MKRKAKYFAKLKDRTEKARKDISNGTGYYKGIACEDEETEEPTRKKRRQQLIADGNSQAALDTLGMAQDKMAEKMLEDDDN